MFEAFYGIQTLLQL